MPSPHVAASLCPYGETIGLCELFEGTDPVVWVPSVGPHLTYHLPNAPPPRPGHGAGGIGLHWPSRGTNTQSATASHDALVKLVVSLSRLVADDMGALGWCCQPPSCRPCSPRGHGRGPPCLSPPLGSLQDRGPRALRKTSARPRTRLPAPGPTLAADASLSAPSPMASSNNWILIKRMGAREQFTTLACAEALQLNRLCLESQAV